MFIPGSLTLEIFAGNNVSTLTSLGKITVYEVTGSIGTFTFASPISARYVKVMGVLPQQDMTLCEVLVNSNAAGM